MVLSESRYLGTGTNKKQWFALTRTQYTVLNSADFFSIKSKIQPTNINRLLFAVGVFILKQLYKFCKINWT